MKRRKSIRQMRKEAWAPIADDLRALCAIGAPGSLGDTDSGG